MMCQPTRCLDQVDLRVRWTSNLTERALWCRAPRLLLLDHSVTHAEAADYVRDLLATDPAA